MIKLNLRENYDLDNNGSITDQELANSTQLLELELREEKASTQKRISWIVLVSMLATTIVLLSPFISNDKIKALSDLLSMYYLASASIIGFYFGAAAYMSK